jgi:putative membrane protein insertion efficiency factor
MEQINRLLRNIAKKPIIFYQYCFRPVMKPSCRFYPSCSEYALTAIESFGICKGFIVTCRRLLRCHPWSEGGFDPVIPNKEKI